MNQLLHLQEKIRTNGAALSRLEAELSIRPTSGGLLSNILSLRRLQGNLQSAFQREADQIGLDICHYKLLENQPSANALSRAIGGFQDALTFAYDAIRHGAKSRRLLTSGSEAESKLQVAYSYPGSFGIVFTIPNERFLFPDMKSYLDRAAETVLTVGKAGDNVAAVSTVAREVGRGPITAIYDWAKANTEYNSGAEIEWRRDDNTLSEVSIQVPEFAALSQTLERMDEKTEEELHFNGVLVGADIKTRRFHFLVDGSLEDIRGKFSDAISETQQRLLPARYAAVIQKTTEKTFAMEQEKIFYFLTRLTERA